MDRIVAPTANSEDEEHLQTALRPRDLAEFIGQDLQRRRLSIALEAARQRREPLDHLLLSGPPGLGKTTLAHIVAAEMHGKLVSTSGPALERAADLMGMLTRLNQGDVSSSERSPACRASSPSTCTRRWRISRSTSCSIRAPTPRQFEFRSNRSPWWA